MVEVRPGLLLGNEEDALTAVSGKLAVTHILSISNQPPDWRDPDQSEPALATGSDGEDAEELKREMRGRGGCKMATMFLEAADLPKTDLLHHFEECCQFIKEGVEHGGILVHCVYGISRSATVVLAYLMWQERRPLQVLFREVQARKTDIRPNAGFMDQLELWGVMRCRVDVRNKQYKVYRLKHMASTMEFKDSPCVEEVKSAMSADPNIQPLDSTAYYRCRKCRRQLFTEDSVLFHEEGKGQAAFKWHKRSKPSPSPGGLLGDSIAPPTQQLEPDATGGRSLGSTSNTACSSYFVEPVEWMDELLLGTVEGKVTCPKCTSRLGSFSWIGHQCSCGQWVTPSFQIHKSKVDETRSLSKRKPHSSTDSDSYS